MAPEATEVKKERPSRRYLVFKQEATIVKKERPSRRYLVFKQDATVVKKGRPSKQYLALKQEEERNDTTPAATEVKKERPSRRYLAFKQETTEVKKRTPSRKYLAVKQEASVVKKGRPSKQYLAIKQEEGRNDTTSENRCPICFMVFSRKKGLTVHMRTHTGEKPYECTYPGCTSKHKQSSHLRTHQYKHTGETPFACPATGCTVRFRHTNRVCPRHPSLKLIKDGKHKVRTNLRGFSHAQRDWIRRYKQKQQGAAKGTEPPSENMEPSEEEPSESSNILQLNNGDVVKGARDYLVLVYGLEWVDTFLENVSTH